MLGSNLCNCNRLFANPRPQFETLAVHHKYPLYSRRLIVYNSTSPICTLSARPAFNMLIISLPFGGGSGNVQLAGACRGFRPAGCVHHFTVIRCAQFVGRGPSDHSFIRSHTHTYTHGNEAEDARPEHRCLLINNLNGTRNRFMCVRELHPAAVGLSEQDGI